MSFSPAQLLYDDHVTVRGNSSRAKPTGTSSKWPKFGLSSSKDSPSTAKYVHQAANHHTQPTSSRLHKPMPTGAHPLSVLETVADAPPVTMRLDVSAQEKNGSASERDIYLTSQENLLKLPPAELASIVIRLHDENCQLRAARYPPRISSQSTETRSNSPSISRERWDEQQGRLKSAQEEIQQLKEALAQTAQLLEQAELKASEANKKAKKTLNELARVTVVEGNMYDDNHFKELVLRLRSDIRNWAKNQDWQVPHASVFWSSTRKDAWKNLGNASKYYEEYLASTAGIELLVEAYIWRYLVGSVFAKYVWAEAQETTRYPGPYQKSRTPIANLSSHFEEMFPDKKFDGPLHEWRVATSRLLAKRDPKDIEVENAKAIRKRTLNLTEQLKGVARASVDQQTLGKILQMAVEIDRLLHQQRPSYVFLPPPSPDPDPEEEMPLNWNIVETVFAEDNNISRDQEPQVKLVVRPGFVKLGNAAGRNYDSDRICLLNIVVDVV